MDKQQFLLDQLADKVKVFKAESEKHKRLHRRLRYAVFLLTSLSALLAGLALKFPESAAAISVVILLVSAGTGVLTSVEGLRKPAELWIHERMTYYALMDLQREAAFVLDEASPPELLEKYFFRLQEILGASNDKWNRQIVGKRQTQSADAASAGRPAPAEV
ncbi:DUF4231 domain-containing protein [Azonexus sp.]|uniref:DUF4231 domain-containing protein n=1 Tax=Azonexus sp. TaxID=1872668 RepID=UPI0035B210EB